MCLKESILRSKQTGHWSPRLTWGPQCTLGHACVHRPSPSWHMGSQGTDFAVMMTVLGDHREGHRWGADRAREPGPPTQ